MVNIKARVQKSSFFFMLPKGKILICISQFSLAFIFVVQVRLRQKYYALQVQPNRGSNPWPPDYDSTSQVPETSVLTTRPLETILHIYK